MYQHVLVGTDGSPTANEAVRQAAALARLSGARLTVLSAHTGGKDRDPDAPADLQWSLTAAATAQEAASTAAAMARGLGVDARARVIRDEDPADAILKVAEEEDVDLIVVGSRGMSSPTRFLLGNVPNAVSHHASCDVAIIHTA